MKSCTVPNCTKPFFSKGKCRYHYFKEYAAKKGISIRKGSKIVFGHKAAKKMSVGRLKKDLEVLYAPVVRMEAADSEGYCICVCCKMRLPWKPEMIDNGERKILPSRFMTTGHWIARRKSKSVEYRRWNTYPECNDCNWKEPPTFTLYMIETYGREKVDWFLAQSNIPWKPAPFEVELLIKEYVEKFLTQCKRLNYTPSVKEQKIIDKYSNNNS